MGYNVPHRHGELNIQGCGLSVSLAAARALHPREVQEVVAAVVSRIAARSISVGALTIGHIKVILKANGQFVNADTIGEKYGTHVSGTIDRPLNSAVLTVNSIIVGLNSDIIEHLTLESIREEFEPRGFEILVKESYSQGRITGSEGGHNHEDNT